MRRFPAVLAGLLVAFLVSAPVSVATPLAECSAELHAGDQRLGPARVPVVGRVGGQLTGYSRTGYRPVGEFLASFYDAAAGAWHYPPADGYVIGPDDQPVRWTQTLRRGQRIDRYGSEYGAFLAPMGLAYTMRSIPPSNLVGSPAAACNYSAYRVSRPFDVLAGPIAPWFFQLGGGPQYQLSAALVPGSPPRLTVLWLVENGYLDRVVSPST